MKTLLQRVSSAKVEIDGRTVGEIQRGLLIFFCAVTGDSEQDLDYLVNKILALRIFEDDSGKMNLSIMDQQGSILVVPQFTLAASTRKGNRPSFDTAESPDQARILFDVFVRKLRETGITVQTGVFAETMAVSLTNDGPVTILIDSREK